MRNDHLWSETKYVRNRRGLKGSRDTAFVGVGSRLMADTVAGFYEDVIPRFAGGRLLDLGCGSAPLFGAYRGHVREVLCIDWPSSVHSCPHVDVACDLSAGLPLAAACVQTVVLSDVLEHIRHPERLMGEVARVLVPGGHLLMNVPFLYGLHERPHDYFRFSVYALKCMIADAGLELVEVRALGGSPHVLADLLAKHLQVMPLLGRPAAALLQLLASWMSRTRIGQRTTRRSAEFFPYAYGLVARLGPPNDCGACS